MLGTARQILDLPHVRAVTLAELGRVLPPRKMKREEWDAVAEAVVASAEPVSGPGTEAEETVAWVAAYLLAWGQRGAVEVWEELSPDGRAEALREGEPLRVGGALLVRAEAVARHVTRELAEPVKAREVALRLGRAGWRPEQPTVRVGDGAPVKARYWRAPERWEGAA